MTPEEKALERFVKERQRSTKKASIFDLEDDEDNGGLTHLGQSLSLHSSSKVDDFDENVSATSEDETTTWDMGRPSKRAKLSPPEENGITNVLSDIEEPLKKPMNRNEVMKEVIKKSKFYKYERQQAKDDDEDLRAQLDEGLNDLFTLMRGGKQDQSVSEKSKGTPPNHDNVHPERLALLNGKDPTQADRQYDERLRQMAMDIRANPTDRTLTEEERQQREADQLRQLELKRQRRMRGDSDNDSTDSDDAEHTDLGEEKEETLSFGLGQGLGTRSAKSRIDVESEDEFLIEEDLVASDTGSEISLQDTESQSDELEEPTINDKGDDDFVGDILTKSDEGRVDLPLSPHKSQSTSTQDLAYTFPCPTTHEDLLQLTKNIPLVNLSTVIQRIRVLHQPHLATENKTALGAFSQVLVQHLLYLGNNSVRPPFAVLESLIRHVHSMAKSYPLEVGMAFRDHLQTIYEHHPLSFDPGDLMIFTAIGAIFPTSDHFHQVVTPAVLCMTRYLEQKTPRSLSDLLIGLFVCSLCVRFQRLSKRYMPEVINYVVRAICCLLPDIPAELSSHVPKFHGVNGLEIDDSVGFSDLDIIQPKRLDFWSTCSNELSTQQQKGLRYQLLNIQLSLIDSMAALWKEKSAFCEIFGSTHAILEYLADQNKSSHLSDHLIDKVMKSRDHLYILLVSSMSARQPLRLHNHRPQPIKTSIPKFEESYNPDRHYDPDKERSDLSKLRAEHKKERKGALRELRKDANFLARESLREKRERDAAYEKKYRRLVAEIQGEEGREAKLYEKEKQARKRTR